MNRRTRLLLTVSALAYAWLAYGVERFQFGLLVVLFALLFGAYYWLLHDAPRNPNWRVLLFWAVAFRLLWLPALPTLSDDYYRFVWDGRLVLQGENPYLHRPADYLARPAAERPAGLDSTLFARLNSPNYYSVYPPVSQMIFGVGAALSPRSVRGHVVVMRLFGLAAEGATLWLMGWLLSRLALPRWWVLRYALNPLVVVELTGNLHFEAIMICFLLLAVALLSVGRLAGAAGAGVALALATLTKLVPVVLAPLWLVRLRRWHPLAFVADGLLVAALLAAPFLRSEVPTRFGSSLNLYFQAFEFNASLYYLVRWVGYEVTGYNVIARAGPLLAAVGAALMLFLLGRDLLFRRSLPKGVLSVGPPFFRSALLILTVYYLFATTVHPWYITTLVALSTFTSFRYATVWSALVVLSYATYRTPAYTESYWLVALQYVGVYGFLFYELLWPVAKRPAAPGSG